MSMQRGICQSNCQTADWGKQCATRQGEVSLCLANNLAYIAYKTLSLPPPAPRGMGDEYMKKFGLVPLLFRHCRGLSS